MYNTPRASAHIRYELISSHYDGTTYLAEPQAGFCLAIVMWIASHFWAALERQVDVEKRKRLFMSSIQLLLSWNDPIHWVRQ